MDDKAHIRLIDPHTECDGCNHDERFIADKRLLMRCALGVA